MEVDTITILIVREVIKVLLIRVDWIVQMGWQIEMDLKIVSQEKEEKIQT